MPNPTSSPAVRNPEIQCTTTATTTSSSAAAALLLFQQVVEITHGVLDNGTRRKLSPIEKSVLLILAIRGDWRTGERIYPSIATLARQAGIQPRWCGRVLAQLKAFGFVEDVKAGGGYGTTIRRLNVERIQAAAAAGRATFQAPQRRGRRPQTPGLQDRGIAPLAATDPRPTDHQTPGLQASPPPAYRPPNLVFDLSVERQDEKAFATESRTRTEEPENNQDEQQEPFKDWREAMRLYRAESKGWNRDIVSSASA